MNLKSPETIIENIATLPLSKEIQKFFQENGKKLSIEDVHALILKLRM